MREEINCLLVFSSVVEDVIYKPDYNEHTVSSRESVLRRSLLVGEL